MVRRARFYTASGPDDRGATPGQLSTIPTAAAARIVFHRAGDAEAEEPTVQQLIEPVGTLTGRGALPRPVPPLSLLGLSKILQHLYWYRDDIGLAPGRRDP